MTEAAASNRLTPALRAFDGVAERFDDRYSAWRSVQAQRAAVRRALLRAFPPNARILELGGGTGDDAAWLALRGRRVVCTDGAPRMVAEARVRAARLGVSAAMECARAPIETLECFAAGLVIERRAAFDGAFSNFAALNCVEDLRPVGRALAALLRPGGRALLVVFGPYSIGEVVVQLIRRDPRAAFRRLARGPVPARLSGQDFSVRYHRPAAYARAFDPWFRLRRVRGIGIFVPPSAAEPLMSRFPRVIAALAAMDRLVSRPLARLGDHVLLEFERTGVAAPVLESAG